MKSPLQAMRDLLQRIFSTTGNKAQEEAKIIEEFRQEEESE